MFAYARKWRFDSSADWSLFSVNIAESECEIEIEGQRTREREWVCVMSTFPGWLYFSVEFSSAFTLSLLFVPHLSTIHQLTIWHSWPQICVKLSQIEETFCLLLHSSQWFISKYSTTSLSTPFIHSVITPLHLQPCTLCFTLHPPHPSTPLPSATHNYTFTQRQHNFDHTSRQSNTVASKQV